jgi:uncharacterized OB-fold protein
MELAREPRLACAHLLHQGPDGPSLLGSRCLSCGEIYFAAGRGCTRCCGTRLEPVDLGASGRLWSWTVQGFLPKAPYNGGQSEGDFQPYGVGYVEMPSGIKIESRLTVSDPAQLRIGMRMQLTLQPYGRSAQGESQVTFAFAPAAEPGNE